MCSVAAGVSCAECVFAQATLVCINAAMIGIQADHGTKENAPIFEILEIIMVAIFTAEIAVRMFALGTM